MYSGDPSRRTATLQKRKADGLIVTRIMFPGKARQLISKSRVRNHGICYTGKDKRENYGTVAQQTRPTIT